MNLLQGANANLIRLFRALKDRLRPKSGNILIYLVMVMLIFGVLGVTMATLFSTSISSSATDNDQRRALYLSESGTRYAMSELRHRGFLDSVIDPLNQTLFNLPPPGAFDLNILSYWFEFASGPDIPGSGTGTITVDIPKGEIPQGAWPSTPGNLFLVQCNYIDRVNSRPDQNPQDSGRAIVTGFTIDPLNRTTFDINLVDDGSDGFEEPAPRAQLCFAVKPYSDQLIVPFSELRVDAAAKDIFPKTDGAIEVNGRPLFYRSAVDKGTYVELTNITFANWDRLIAVPKEQVWKASDYIILSPRNYVVLSQGQSSNVTFGGDMAHSMAVARQTEGGEAPDIGPDNLDYSETGDFQQTKSTSNFIQLNETEKSITLGGGSGNRLGSVFFRDTRNIGGNRDFCSNGSCLFDRGIRLFFTLEYTGSGDGLIFSLINGASNSSSSIGGEKDFAELLGYSGDGRLDAGGTQFIPGSTKNLNPPKIGLEFDAKVNYDYQDEQALKYCDGSSLNACTRNDPGSIQSSVCDITSNSSGTKDAVQYVFWGNSSLNILCRGNDPSYDDNRHNASGSGSRNWAFNTTWDINSSPALAPDGTIYAGTIYIGSNSTNFYAVNSDGLERWHIDISGFWYSPTVSKTGNIYVGSSDKKLYAIKDNGNSASILWTFDTRNKGTVNGGAITTKPAINNNGDTIFFGCDDGFFYAVSSDGNEIWRFDTNSIFGPSQIKTSAALSPPPGPSTNENYVYFGSTRGVFYAKRTDNGGGLWSVSISAGIRSSPAVRSSDGVVYVGADDGNLYAFNGTTGNPLGGNFPFNAGSSAITSSPAVDSNGTVYFGYSDHKLYAIGGSSGSKIWDFTTGGIVASSPAIDSNNHIYFGSNDKKIYALYNDGTLKWSISTLDIGPGGDVKGRPAVQVDGTVYTGCSDFRLYSINQFANPKNFKDKLITYDTNKVGGEPVVVDSTDDWLKGASSKGPWAVRMEVVRNLLDPSNGTYAYSLKTWLRQCSRPDCSDTTANDPLGTFFEDTRIEYSPPTHLPQLAQTINILEGTPSVFERFLFGFTSQTASGDVQTATIRNFKLSFIRPNDPIVTVDPNWP